MKALILAAGLGTRLLPHTAIRPKPLFAINGLTLLQRTIEQLIQAGCTDIIINTHHLHNQIEKFIRNYKSKNNLSVNICTIHEPEILETGGAIRNVRHFMCNDHFMVINSDIVSDIDLRSVWNFHIKHSLSERYCVTLALHDYSVHNKVTVDKNLFIRNFLGSKLQPDYQGLSDSNCCKSVHIQPSLDYKVLAFTGIQVLSPEIFDHMPDNQGKLEIVPFSSIELYSDLAHKGDMVKAFICKDIFWQDIGTPETYRDAAIRFSADYHLNKAFFTASYKTKENTLFSSSPSNFQPSPYIKYIKTQKLAGDGSDRGWYRCRLSVCPGVSKHQQSQPNCLGSNLNVALPEPSTALSYEDNSVTSLIIADHGIHCEPYKNMSYEKDAAAKNEDALGKQVVPEKKSLYKTREIDSFIRIGQHLFEKGIPVPAIKSYDRFAGLVVLEDLGDLHLQDVIQMLATNRHSSSTNGHELLANRNFILEWYKKACRLAISFSMDGIKGFHDAWTFQSASYSKEMILEKECRYFVEAFLQGYLKQKIEFDSLKSEFEFIADNALEHSFQGLMHRDMQSRNIMVKPEEKYLSSETSLYKYFHSQDVLDNSNLFFIDFQSSRRGPLQYDLASLLIDPYVNLEDEIRETLLHDCANEVERLTGKNTVQFIKSYRYCALTRNMQMLGAFSHLSMNRGKTFFEQYIPVALENLKKNISYTDIDKTRYLYQCIRSL
ncbi:MAG: NTP transferase domain-containing protein [Desulfamplus sp.]|nr:NTP transferase domain-containing protein [Desulfamplus sp.]